MKWSVTIEAWPYSTGKGCDHDQKNAGDRVQCFMVEADNISEAMKLAKAIQTGMKASPHVWEAPIYGIERAKDF
jgi:hypothetical protein